MIPVTLGYIASVTMPGIEDANAIVPLLAIEHLHPVIVAVFVGAIVSAIMSTSDSILLGCGTVISVNLLPRVINRCPVHGFQRQHRDFGNCDRRVGRICDVEWSGHPGHLVEEAEQARWLCRHHLGTRRICDRRIPVPGDSREFRRFLCITRRRDYRLITDAAVG
jgi:hypothetical protein